MIFTDPQVFSTCPQVVFTVTQVVSTHPQVIFTNRQLISTHPQIIFTHPQLIFSPTEHFILIGRRSALTGKSIYLIGELFALIGR